MKRIWEAWTMNSIEDEHEKVWEAWTMNSMEDEHEKNLGKNEGWGRIREWHAS
jgi:hypothetical protein